MHNLQVRIGVDNQERGWHDRWNEVKDTDAATDHLAAKLALIHSEVSEALEELRNGRHYTEVYYNGEKPEGFPVELADTVIRILDLCAMTGIDLEAVLLKKLAFNVTRGHKHGGKVL